MVRSGKLRHRVTIEKPGYTQDPNTGEQIPGWELVGNVWADVSPLSAREFIAAQATQSEISARITIRYRPDLSADMRILHRGRIYNPAGMIPDQVSGIEHITIPVSEGVDEGL